MEGPVHRRELNLELSMTSGARLLGTVLVQALFVPEAIAVASVVRGI